MGCGAFVYETESPDVTKFVSYLDFCFADLDQNKDALAYYSIFHHFNVFLSERKLPDDLAMHFVLRPTGFNGGALGMGWSGELGLQGFGVTVEQARTLPSLAFSLLVEFLEKL